MTKKFQVQPASSSAAVHLQLAASHAAVEEEKPPGRELTLTRGTRSPSHSVAGPDGLAESAAGSAEVKALAATVYRELRDRCLRDLADLSSGAEAAPASWSDRTCMLEWMLEDVSHQPEPGLRAAMLQMIARDIELAEGESWLKNRMSVAPLFADVTANLKLQQLLSRAQALGAPEAPPVAERRLSILQDALLGLEGLGLEQSEYRRGRIADVLRAMIESMTNNADPHLAMALSLLDGVNEQAPLRAVPLPIAREWNPERPIAPRTPLEADIKGEPDGIPDDLRLARPPRNARQRTHWARRLFPLSGAAEDAAGPRDRWPTVSLVTQCLARVIQRCRQHGRGAPLL